MENVTIIGAACAGLTAAIYAARANLSPLVVAGTFKPGNVSVPGGQLMTTTDVENFPGFPAGIKGPELIKAMRAQAERFGARFIDNDEVVTLDGSGRSLALTLDGGDRIETKAAIVATGAVPRTIDIPSWETYWNRGVGTCAVCDGHFFRGKEVAIVGGGDSALEEAQYMAKLCPRVYLIHRRDSLRGSKIMQDHALKNPVIQPVWDSTVEEILGDGTRVTGARIKNVKTGATSELALGALFAAIGHVPATAFLKGSVALDEQGYIPVTRGTFTNVAGVFAAGDCVDHVYRQAVTAAGMGCMAAMDVERWLATQG
ncbi:MAG: thioredoxin-disulfide reductase [Planctomycetes bacterium]|nr:thioredoxin-disulfide reductase [Planctomycetota bacterium]